MENAEKTRADFTGWSNGGLMEGVMLLISLTGIGGPFSGVVWRTA
jgi:hypothetical protein